MNHLFKDLQSHKIENHMINEVRRKSIPLNNAADFDPLMDKIGDSSYVLLGEASHGTHEYYLWRAELTKRLIREKGFSFIGVEGDWPDCYRLNRYVKGYPDSGNNAYDVLHDFNRWPTWMWANWEIVAFSEWLRSYNSEQPANKKVGFYGLDMYSLGESLDAILKYLQHNDPHAYATAKKAMSCFEPFGCEGQSYGYSTKLLPDNCKDEVINLLKEIRSKIASYNTDHETVFSTEQNALIAVHAENYYREMVKGGPMSWNIRDKHMVETLDRLMDFHGPAAKAIVWEHNTHIGDARATDMSKQGMVNVGELLTYNHRSEGVIKVGFGSNRGTVIAGRSWGDDIRIMTVPAGIKGSWENILHQAGEQDKLLLLDQWKIDGLFNHSVGHRAIGVVYRPEYEKYGNYVPSIIPERYDAFIYIDQTKALHPLHIAPNGHETPETYPWGF